MRSHNLFQPSDLDALEGLLEKASAVVPMEDVADGLADDGMIGMRHDCDNVILPAIAMAKWEAARGYRSTYYVLHTAPYWQDKRMLRLALDIFDTCGHEIGIHNDALTVALETGRDSADVLHEATEELRGYGHTIRSTVAHGNHLCGVAKYVNDEMFSECARADYGEPDRVLEHEGRKVKLNPVSFDQFDLEFDSNWLSRGDYLSDSGGTWSQPFDLVASKYPSKGQLHILCHPDWWSNALTSSEVPA